MRVVDTSTWTEWLVGSPFGRTLARHLPQGERWVVPTVVQFEPAKWLTREIDEETADRVIAFTETCIVADLDTKIALSAADLCVRHRLATADAIVYATALEYDADLLTCDRHFDGLPGVVLVAKPTG